MWVTGLWTRSWLARDSAFPSFTVSYFGNGGFVMAVIGSQWQEVAGVHPRPTNDVQSPARTATVNHLHTHTSLQPPANTLAVTQD